MGYLFDDPIDVDTDPDIEDIAALSPADGDLLRYSTDGSRYSGVQPSALTVTPTTGTTSRTLAARFDEVFRDQDYGNTSTAPGTAILAAATAADTAGGGVVLIGRGTRTIEEPGAGYKLSFNNMDNVHVAGAGVGATIIIPANDTDAASNGVVAFNTANRVSMRDMTLDGNRANMPEGTHCFRGADVVHLVLDGMEFKNSNGYAIGLQDGSFERVIISNFWFHDTDGDALDIKNRNDDGDENWGLILVNGWAENWGLGSSSQQAAYDLRGTWLTSNLFARTPGAADATAWRARFGEAGDGANGYGGHASQLHGFHFDLGTGASAIGADSGARHVTLSGGYIYGGFRAVTVVGAYNKISGVTVEGLISSASSAAFQLGISGGLQADYAMLTNCVAVRASGVGIGFSLETLLSHISLGVVKGYTTGIEVTATAEDLLILGQVIENNTTGVSIASGAKRTSIIGARFKGNTTNITDLGTDTYVANCNDVMNSPLPSNRILNGDFRFNQRAPGAVASADDTYAHDGWYVLTQSNNITVVTTANPENGQGQAGTLSQSNVTAQRIGYAQIIENAECVDLRGKSVYLSGRIATSHSITMRYAILEWTGTADTVTSDVVNDWTSATFTAGNFFNSTTLNVLATGSVATNTTWRDVTPLQATVGSSMNNLIVMFWTDATYAQNRTFSIGKIALEQGRQPHRSEPPSYAQELERCRRRFRKSTFYVPATTAQNLGVIDMRITPAITGGGAGFTSTGTSADVLVAFQTAGATAALSLDADL